VIKELRDFLFRGNVIDLAVAVVLGAAFGAIVNSFVADILTPLLGLLGVPDFTTWTITVGSATMRIGLFLNAVISFLLIGVSVFFLIVKPANALKARSEEAPAGPTEVELLAEIRDELRSRPA
jgi:large conductance mechanosensitive channel